MYGINKRLRMPVVIIALLTGFTAVCSASSNDDDSREYRNDKNLKQAMKQMREGRQIFRFDTFGDEALWGDALRLHEAIAGEDNGGIGAGVSPKTALSLGLKVDVRALPKSLRKQLKRDEVDLDDPATTLALIKLNAVVGVTGFFNTGGQIESMGIQCALCHSTVDNSFAPGIGRRLDGWANRDLNVGAIVAAAPDLSSFAALLGVDQTTVRAVLNSWGPGKFDAALFLDGKAFRPDGKSGATLIPPAFGLAGVNMHTWTGWGSVAYWNAFVAVLEMGGKGNLYDPRLNDASRFPIAAANGFADVRIAPDQDRVSSKLPALHLYQLALAAPKAPDDSFDEARAERGEMIFNGKAQCGRCHVPPLYTEPGRNLRLAEEIGIDDFQASRSPEGGYRTTPLKGLWTHRQGGFYHDGRFATLGDVISHYDNFFGLALDADEKLDLTEFLKSL